MIIYNPNPASGQHWSDFLWIKWTQKFHIVGVLVLITRQLEWVHSEPVERYQVKIIADEYFPG